MMTGANCQLMKTGAITGHLALQACSALLALVAPSKDTPLLYKHPLYSRTMKSHGESTCPRLCSGWWSEPKFEWKTDSVSRIPLSLARCF